ncbi:MAG: type II toxin-antitoxin system HicB family antitoxin [Eubacteriales bacterium]|nr:type II toxin-antitoxin system HicB family antitoxin [Eubacteriales bacterium]
MKFYYPAVVTKTENHYHAVFPDLAMCEADGDTLDDVLENARSAAYNWIELELSEPNPNLPASSDKYDLRENAAENQTVHEILVIIRLMEGWEE